MKNHIKVREYSSYRLKFGLFLKLNKNYGAPMKNSELFCFKDTKNFAALFFVAAGNKKFQRANAQPYTYVANKSSRWLVEGTRRMNTGLTSTHTTRGLSVLYYHLFPRKQCILCSALRRKCCLTLLYVTSIRVFFSALGTISHGPIRLAPLSLVSSRGCLFKQLFPLALLCWLVSGFFVLIVLRHSWVSRVFIPRDDPL